MRRRDSGRWNSLPGHLSQKLRFSVLNHPVLLLCRCNDLGKQGQRNAGREHTPFRRRTGAWHTGKEHTSSFALSWKQSVANLGLLPNGLLFWIFYHPISKRSLVEKNQNTYKIEVVLWALCGCPLLNWVKISQAENHNLAFINAYHY